MTSVEFTSEDIDLCEKFIQEILSTIDQNGSCQLKSFCFCMTYAELEGEVLDVLSRFLHEQNCPQIFISTLLYMVSSRFLQTDLESFLLVRQENDIKEYDGANVTKALAETFREVCEEIKTKLSSLKLRKNKQCCHVSIHSIKNRRRKMEDRHICYEDLNGLLKTTQSTCCQLLFAVFDGHGGTDAANYAASQFVCKLKATENLTADPANAIKEAILKTDSDFMLKAKRERLRSGTTAVLVLIQDKKMIVSWLGDSQVVLCKAGQAIQLMEPHKPDRQDERERIEALGGCVVFFGGWRVNGSLSVSRAIGDYEQRPFITSEPDVEEYEMEGDEEFLILACDGLWDTVEPLRAVRKVQQCIKDGTRDQAAEILSDLAKKKGSMDNITIMVVYLDFNGSTRAPEETAELASEQTTTKEEELDEKNIVANDKDSTLNVDINTLDDKLKENATISDKNQTT